MVTTHIEYQGALRCSARHEPSGALIQTDAPKDNCGKGEAFSPTDLVGTALGTCVMTIMGIKAQEHGWDLAGMRATVVKRMVADPVRRIGGLTLVLDGLPGGLDSKARTILERAGRACPVKASLHEAVLVELEFCWE